MKKIAIFPILLLWAGLAACAWFSPAEEISNAERRELAQFPSFSVESVLSGRFMSEFEAYTQDQFPLRQGLRTVKALFSRCVLGQQDSNGLYLAQGHAAVQEYPLDQESLAYAAQRFSYLYDTYLSECAVSMAIVPDKGWYLAPDSGHLTLSLPELTAYFAEALPWAAQIDLTSALDAGSYYRTDPHWRQEALLEAAGQLCRGLGVTAPDPGDYTEAVLTDSFRGAYAGQTALPMAAEPLRVLESDLLAGCTVFDHETGQTIPLYHRDAADSRDPYDVFLGGARSLLTIENPAGDPERELIVFRDSFASAIVPLLLTDYSRVTLVDIRYLHPSLLGRHIDFSGQDVLLLYSTLVLNNSQTLK